MVRFLRGHPTFTVRFLLGLLGGSVMIRGLGALAEGVPSYLNQFNMSESSHLAVVFGVLILRAAVLPWPRRDRDSRNR